MLKLTKPVQLSLTSDRSSLKKAYSYFCKTLDKQIEGCVELILYVPERITLKSNLSDFRHLRQSSKDSTEFWGCKSKTAQEILALDSNLSDFPEYIWSDGFDHYLKVYKSKEDKIQLTIKTLTGHSFQICVGSSWSIEDVKNEVQLFTDVTPVEQRLIFEGKQLEDTKTLVHYNIIGNSILHLVLRLRGGMYDESSGRLDFVSINKQQYLPAARVTSVISIGNERHLIHSNAHSPVSKILLFAGLLCAPQQMAKILSLEQKQKLLSHDIQQLTSDAVNAIKALV